MAGPAITSDSEAIAAFESFVEESGEFDDLIENSDTQETPEDEGNLPETEEDSEETADEDELSASEEDEESTDKDEEDLSSVDALAQYFEVEPEELLESIRIEDPYGNEVSVAQAMQSWRAAEDSVSQRRAELEREFATARSEYDTQATQAVTQLASITKQMIEEMRSNYAPEIIQHLRESDPEEYVRAMERKHQLDQQIERAINSVKAESERQSAHSQEDMKRILAEEHQKMIQAIPEWRDDKRRTEAMHLATKYLKEDIGFSDEDINSITDHRLMVILRDAVLGRQLRKGGDSKKITELKKRGLKRPELRLKGQTRRDLSSHKNRERQAATARLQKTGRVEDAAKVLENFID